LHHRGVDLDVADAVNSAARDYHFLMSVPLTSMLSSITKPEKSGPTSVPSSKTMSMLMIVEPAVIGGNICSGLDGSIRTRDQPCWGVSGVTVALLQAPAKWPAVTP